ncbi:VOC family protein [Paenibacillus sp. 481]|uniref:VOC family protein n=1 Tax=Paenibacillus sp. 481 TaxID=2835869 RepID=UPI001E42E636|nr:VOC family protein [Paenibacillus sp. 481]UHA71801.1 VOC family protein [Paenibacillus sp. 481]
MNFHQHPTTYVGSVHLAVTDVERSLTFYTEVLGLQLLSRNGNTAALTADGTTVLVSLEEHTDALKKLPRTTGLYHFALLVPSRADLARVLQHIANQNYPLQGVSDHQFSEAIYLADPDGHGIEIYTDRSPDVWAWQNGELPFVSNPIDIANLLRDGGDIAWTGFPAETVMGHIHLHVADLDQAKQFYVDGLGFEVTVPMRHQALFVADGKYHHHIGLNTWQGQGAPAPAPNTIGMKWYTVIVPSMEARQAIEGRLRAIGAPLDEQDGVLWTTDPSGHRIQLLV